MKVLFDGHWWVNGPASNREVLKQIVLTWSRDYTDDQIVLAVPRRHVGAVRNELGKDVKVVPTRLSPHGVSAILELPFLNLRHKADVMIAHNFAPAFGPSVVFVHDFLFLTNPEWFTFAERRYFGFMPLLARRAKMIFTSSKNEAQRIRRFSTKGKPIHPIGLGANTGVIHAAPRPVTELAGVRGFILSVGRLNIRKNLGMTLDAALESGRISAQYPLVVVGAESGKVAEFSPRLREAVESGAIRFLGYTSNEELAWLYSRADAFVFLSLDEGFGMPLLEALSFGTKVLASDIPVFREIMGDAAVFVDPTDLAAASAGIRSVLDAEPDPASTSRVLEKYSWAGTVRRMRQHLRAASEDLPRPGTDSPPRPAPAG